MSSKISVPVRLTATGVVMNAPGFLHGVLVGTDGTNTVTITLYDNASAGSGTKLTPAFTVLGTVGAQMIIFPSVWCKAGIHATIAVAGGGTTEIIFYCRKS
jgi:hypothetical protein